VGETFGSVVGRTEQIVGTNNERRSHRRAMDVVLEDFRAFLDG
jgi:hypothetical protein